MMDTKIGALLCTLSVIALVGAIFLIALGMVLRSPEQLEMEMKAGKQELRIKKGGRTRRRQT